MVLSMLTKPYQMEKLCYISNVTLCDTAWWLSVILLSELELGVLIKADGWDIHIVIYLCDILCPNQTICLTMLVCLH